MFTGVASGGLTNHPAADGLSTQHISNGSPDAQTPFTTHSTAAPGSLLSNLGNSSTEQAPRLPSNQKGKGAVRTFSLKAGVTELISKIPTWAGGSSSKSAPPADSEPGEDGDDENEEYDDGDDTNDANMEDFDLEAQERCSKKRKRELAVSRAARNNRSSTLPSRPPIGYKSKDTPVSSICGICSRMNADVSFFDMKNLV